MRVLHLLSTPAWSGPAENVALLALEQRELGHEVSIAVDRKRGWTRAEEPIVPRIQALGLLDEGGMELSVKSTPFGIFRDVRLLRRREVDVVHCHFSHAHFLCQFGLPPGAVLVRSVHFPSSLRRYVPRADAYTLFSRGDAARLRGRRVVVLPALVGPEFRPPADISDLRRQLGIGGEPLVGMISNFQPSRRHDLGLRAFALLRHVRPAAHLAIVGDGDLEQEIRAQVREMGLSPAVTFAGYQQGAAFVRWVQSLDEVWLLGLGHDWSGRAAAQARACGVRVVAVDEGGLGELADALARSPTPEDVRDASLSGLRVARAFQSNEQIACAVLALYEQLLLGRSRLPRALES
jgi:glycosyltransferase involved in cell wall biosynthesis